MTSEPRLILAPQIVPDLEPLTDLSAGRPGYYLSWPGWELFLARRLGLKTDLRPILSPGGQDDPEHEYRVLADLADRSEPRLILRPEAGAFGEEGSLALVRALRGESAPSPARAALDDRLFLALWSLAEYRSWEAENFIGRSDHQEREMWAALKGEDLAPAEPRQAAPGISDGPLAARAWASWRRLAAPALRPDDRFSSFPFESAEERGGGPHLTF